MDSQNPFSVEAESSEQVPPVTPPVMPELSQEDRTMAMLAHLLGPILGFLAPLVIWLIKKDQSPFVEDQAKEALNFQIALMIVATVLAATCVGMILLPAVIVADWVYGIMGAVAANNGERYRYPYTIRLIK